MERGAITTAVCTNAYSCTPAERSAGGKAEAASRTSGASNAPTRLSERGLEATEFESTYASASAAAEYGTSLYHAIYVGNAKLSSGWRSQ